MPRAMPWMDCAAIASRWLPRPEFALVALATTLGWLGAVAGDFGVQVHLARAVAQAYFDSRLKLGFPLAPPALRDEVVAKAEASKKESA